MAKPHTNGAVVPFTRRKIIGILNKHKVPRERWGTSTFRTLEDLVGYHQRDKLYFRNGSSKVCTIDVHAAVVIVTHRFNRRWLELYEDRQEFDSGGMLRRDGFNGVAETLKRTELVVEGAHRCLQEELKFRDRSLYQLSDCIRIEERSAQESEKWPGVWAVYHRHIFECVISRKLFNPNGYSEREKGRTIYFKWRERRQNNLPLCM
ncbi:MAG: hypothetical protein RLY66_270 [Candidatus Parcubacteria bacterium]